MAEQRRRIPQDSRSHSAGWLERARQPVQRPKLVEHLFRRAGEDAAAGEEAAAGESASTGLVSILRRQSAKLAEAERELREQTEKLAAVEAELRAVQELARARREGAHAEPDDVAPVPAAASHLLFVSEPDGYSLLEAPGESPLLGSEIRLGAEGPRFVVSRVGPSPLPGDTRRCAYLLRLS